jgi:hypothetical protein
MGKGLRKATGWRRTAIAVLLGYALFIQALWSQAGPAQAAGYAFDPLTGLCEFHEPSQGPDRDSPAAPRPKPHDDSCCTLACAGSGAAAGVALLPAAFEPPVPTSAASGVSAFPGSDIAVAREWRSFTARAPPPALNA